MNPKMAGKMKLTSKQQTIFEIVLVLGVMLLVKDIADRFNAIGAGSIAMWCGIIVATFFQKKQNIAWKSRGLFLPGGKKDWLKSLGYVLLTLILTIVLMGVVTPIISELLGISIPESSTERFEFFLGKPLYFAAYLVVVIWIGAALGEELLMRGFLLNHLTDFFGDDRKGISVAVILHAIIFGMLHISQGIPGIISTALVAVVFAGIYLINHRSLFPLIIAHGIINSMSLLAFYLSDGQLP